MTATGTLIPPSVEATAESRKRLPFGFGPRMFIALAAGLVWLVPAWWWRPSIAALFVWDGVVAAVWILDLLSLPRPRWLEMKREWTAPLELSKPTQVTLEVRNRARSAFYIKIIDQTPLTMREMPPILRGWVPGGGSRLFEYTVTSSERGNAELGGSFLRYRSWLGFAERWAAVPLAQMVRVLPNLSEVRNQALFVVQSRRVEQERRRRRQLGLGRDFESLRDYRGGDEWRDVCWSATARQGRLVIRLFEAERNQAVWVLVDAGRLLRAKVESGDGRVALTKLDYAVNSALSLAQVVSQAGDRVGVAAYGRSVQSLIHPGRGQAHIKLLAESLAHVRPESTEANHGRAAQVLLRGQSRRSLVIWITDFAETVTAPEVVEYAMRVARRHLVVLAAVSQPDLANLAARVPGTVEEMFRNTAAVEITDRRELLLRRLRTSGVLAMELPAGRLTTELINEYLRVKDRNQL